MKLPSFFRRPHVASASFTVASAALVPAEPSIPSEHAYRFQIRDRDSILVDKDLKEFGLKILRTPIEAPKANAYCERLVGTMRRGRLEWVIPLNEKHLRGLLEFCGSG